MSEYSDKPFVFASEGADASKPRSPESEFTDAFSKEVPRPKWIDVESQSSWKVLVVDDEEGIHSVTKLALRHFMVEDKPITFLHAYTATEAREKILAHPDIAVILVDVVMETEHAGLDLVEYIRQHLRNDFVRIVLRTGQPGQAPEMDVIKNLKIDDYRLKTELTQDKLCSVLMASIRTYEAILRVENYRQNLEYKVEERTAEIQRKNQLLEQQKEELEGLNQLKTKLFSILAHDMRSPLGTLQSLLSIAGKDLLPPEDFQRMLNNIHTNLGNTTEMLEKLLTWANSQLKGAQVKAEHFSVNEWLTSLERLYTVTTRQKSIDFSMTVADNLWMYADEDMMTLTLGNLVNNAVKFTPEGGEISIEASEIEREDVRFTRIEVVDNGVGMSQERQDKLTHYGIDSTLGTDGEKGTGLGLVICQDFIKQNKGVFGIESTQGEGATFYFEIPAASPED